MIATPVVVIDVRIVCGARVPCCRDCYDMRAWTGTGRTVADVFESRGPIPTPGSCYMLASAEQIAEWRRSHPGTPGAAERNTCAVCRRIED